MIVKATEKMAPEIRRVWKLCFTAPEDLNADPYYLNEMMHAQDALLYMENDQIVSMMLRRRHVMIFNGRPLACSMIQGVCTVPEYRRKGYMHELMDVQLDACSHTELITLIQAHDPSLYEPFGFRQAYRRNIYKMTREDVRRITNIGCAYQPKPIDMLKVYSAFIRRFNGYYARDLEYFINLKKWIYARGGKIVGYYNGKNQILGYAVMVPQGKELNVEECVYLDSLSLVKLLNAALQERAVINLNVSTAENMHVLFPGAGMEEYCSGMARLNDPALFSKLYGKSVTTIEEALRTGTRPLNLNENE